MSDPQPFEAGKLAQIRDLQGRIREAEADGLKLKDRLQRLLTRAQDAKQRFKQGEEQLQKLSVEAVLAGEDPERPDPVLADAMRKAKRISDASEQATAVLELETDAKSRESEAVKEELRGAIYMLLSQQMDAAGRAVRAALDQLAPLLAELIAIEEARQHFCGGSLKLAAGAAELRPWSGSVVALNMIQKIPSRLRPEGLTEAAINLEARPIFNAICKSIQGE